MPYEDGEWAALHIMIEAATNQEAIDLGDVPAWIQGSSVVLNKTLPNTQPSLETPEGGYDYRTVIDSDYSDQTLVIS
jgi:hypothetical protein